MDNMKGTFASRRYQRRKFVLSVPWTSCEATGPPVFILPLSAATFLQYMAFARNTSEPVTPELRSTPWVSVLVKQRRWDDTTSSCVALRGLVVFKVDSEVFCNVYRVYLKRVVRHAILLQCRLCRSHSPYCSASQPNTDLTVLRHSRIRETIPCLYPFPFHSRR